MCVCVCKCVFPSVRSADGSQSHATSHLIEKMELKHPPNKLSQLSSPRAIQSDEGENKLLSSHCWMSKQSCPVAHHLFWGN